MQTIFGITRFDAHNFFLWGLCQSAVYGCTGHMTNLRWTKTSDYCSCWKKNSRDLKCVWTEINNRLDNWCATKGAQVETYRHFELTLVLVLSFLIFHIPSIFEKVLWLWKINLEILTDLHIFSIPDYKKWFLEWHLSIYLCTCMDVHIASLWTVGRIQFTFGT
jgi:hypothetical protein